MRIHQEIIPDTEKVIELYTAKNRWLNFIFFYKFCFQRELHCNNVHISFFICQLIACTNYVMRYVFNNIDNVRLESHETPYWLLPSGGTEG